MVEDLALGLLPNGFSPSPSSKTRPRLFLISAQGYLLILERERGKEREREKHPSIASRPRPDPGSNLRLFRVLDVAPTNRATLTGARPIYFSSSDILMVTWLRKLTVVILNSLPHPSPPCPVCIARHGKHPLRVPSFYFILFLEDFIMDRIEL